MHAFNLDQSRILSFGKEFIDPIAWSRLKSKLKLNKGNNSINNNDSLHYLPLDGMVNIPIYLVWASWVRNRTTFLSYNVTLKFKLK